MVALQTSTTKGNCVRRAQDYNVCGWMTAILLAVLMPYCSADDTDNASKSQTPEAGNQLNVNWLYGPTFLRMFLYGLSLPNNAGSCMFG
jgi:hypothetical protein